MGVGLIPLVGRSSVRTLRTGDLVVGLTGALGSMTKHLLNIGTRALDLGGKLDVRNEPNLNAMSVKRTLIRVDKTGLKGADARPNHRSALGQGGHESGRRVLQTPATFGSANFGTRLDRDREINHMRPADCESASSTFRHRLRQSF